jgi:hypothetical protein
MNPVENAVRHAYYLLNFFLAQAHLTMLAWCDMLAAAVMVLNTLPRPQSRHLPLRTKSPLELATGVKPDLSRFIAAPGQLVVVHRDGAKASVCAKTASLALFVQPSGAGYLVRNVATWRSFVAYHVRPVHHEIDGIAAQAVAVSHALATGTTRAGSGLLSASAQAVSDSVRSLSAARPLWASPPGPIAILDPVSGLAVRLAHVRLDGTLALEEVGSGRSQMALPRTRPTNSSTAATSQTVFVQCPTYSFPRTALSSTKLRELTTCLPRHHRRGSRRTPVSLPTSRAG